MDTLNEIYSQYLDLIHQLKPVVEESDYAVLDRHIPFLERLDAIDRSSISIFDMNRKSHVYASPSYRKRLGISDEDDLGIEGFDRLMHPDDYLGSLRNSVYFMRFALGLPGDGIRNYKLIQEFRIQNGSGGWLRVVEQFTCLEADHTGKPWLALSILDVSPDQDVETGFRATMTDTLTGELYGMPGTKKAISDENEPLSGRERQILTLISEGLVSKQVADRLFLSIHTVNTHRRNIINKMNVSNTAEAIRQARDMALI
jgi:DNA-binding CsgD family transcriptional regulator/PAS domain-containing protein